MRAPKIIVTVGNLPLFFISIILIVASSIFSTVKFREPLLSPSSFKPLEHGFVATGQVYGHIALPRTGAIKINGKLAAYFQRICGVFGYSYDSFQHNERVKSHATSDSINDFVTKGYKRQGYNRGNLPTGLMEEIGFQNCDWISTSEPRIWKKHYTNFPIPLQIHVPCNKDPLQYVLFSIDQENCRLNPIDELLEKIKEKLKVLDDALADTDSFLRLCFDANDVEQYIKVMSRRLQWKRLINAYTPMHDLQEPPNCVLDADSLRNHSQFSTLSSSYLRFCQQCMGSSHDLFQRETLTVL